MSRVLLAERPPRHPVDSLVVQVEPN